MTSREPANERIRKEKRIRSFAWFDLTRHRGGKTRCGGGGAEYLFLSASACRRCWSVCAVGSLLLALLISAVLYLTLLPCYPFPFPSFLYLFSYSSLLLLFAVLLYPCSSLHYLALPFPSSSLFQFSAFLFTRPHRRPLVASPRIWHTR